MSDGMANAPDAALIPQRRRYLRRLTLIFLLLWSALAIAPFNRQDWALENLLVLIFVVFALALRRRVPLSNTANTLVFAFLVLHSVGAHYTYSLVPYVDWGRALFGFDIHELLGWQRNHFDRLLHFLYGLLLVHPLREVCLRYDSVRGVATWLLPVTLLISGSVFYELIEWAAALIFGGDLGAAYLGTQGDVWDAQKDMALAVLGTLISAVCVAFCDRRASILTAP